jgi:hypothetical protein
VPSPASGWSSPTTPRGFPCCARFPCVRAVATTPAQSLAVLLCSSDQRYQPSPKGSSGRPAHRHFRGLLSVHSRYGPHTRAATNSWHATRRLQPFRYLHDCSGCFRLERLPGGICTHWKAPPLHGAHPLQSSALPNCAPESGQSSSRNRLAEKFDRCSYEPNFRPALTVQTAKCMCAAYPRDAVDNDRK